MENSPAAESPDRSLLTIARNVFLAWEKLRVVYVIILGSVTVMLTGLSLNVDLPLLRLIVLGAVTANVMYFVGPTTETCVQWLGYSRPWLRWLLFVGGTLLSVLLTIGWLATELLPDQQ